MDKKEKCIKFLEDLKLSNILTTEAQSFVNSLFVTVKNDTTTSNDFNGYMRDLLAYSNGKQWVTSIAALLAALDILMQDNPFMHAKEAAPKFVDELESKLFKGAKNNE